MGGFFSKSKEDDSGERRQEEKDEAEGGGASADAKPAPELSSELTVQQVEFSAIEDSIGTGDLAVLYREGWDVPHFAVFVQHAEDDPDFPLLLVKGKSKPLPKEKFNPDLGREAHTTSAINRIFYGDYERVEIRHLETNEKFPIDEVIENVEKVQKIPFSEAELEAIDKATTPEERSALVSVLMVAHFYNTMPVSGDAIFNGNPSQVTPETLQGCLKLSDAKSIKLPPVKPGPLITGEPPLLDRIV